MILVRPRILEQSPAATIRVFGDDAFSFLQGQFTNELRQPPRSATYGLWLDQKGKVLADSHVLGISENEFLVTSAHSAAELILRRLESYIIADEVTLKDETPATKGLLLMGEHAGDALEQILGSRPARNRFVGGKGVMAFAGRRAAGENFEVIGDANAIRNVQAQLRASGVRDLSGDELEFARITAGIPRVPWDVGPGDLPNEAGLEDGAISYTKGCYLGQEVMARLKNLGQVRRRLHVVRGRGFPPASRTALYQADKKVGEIRSAAGRENEFVALAMLSLVNFRADAGLSVEPAGPADLRADPHG
jgi:folate-binding protein YgfZ